jgi:SAM-dependent methyltransferase
MGGASCAVGPVVKMFREGVGMASSSQLGAGNAAEARVEKASDRAKPINGKGFSGGNGKGLLEPLQHPQGPLDAPTVQSKPSQFPDDGFIDECYNRLLDLRGSCASRAELRQGLSELLEEIAVHSGSYSAMVDNLLMKHWLERKDNGLVPYDEHMKEHVEAIKTLFKAWTKDRYSGLPKIRIFDASCGSGKALEAFLESLPPEVLGRVEVVANDVSSASLEAAAKTLGRFKGRLHRKIEFTRYDVTRELPPRQFDIVIFSQTLPFIVDEGTLREQRLGRTLRTDENRHLTAKTTLMRALVKKTLKPGSGELLLIDEDPMKLTEPPDDVDGLIERVLFGEIFREVSESQMIDKMKEISSARFLGQVKSSIDRRHDMYLMAYSKAPKAKRVLDAENDDRDDMLRSREDEMRILHAMENIHPVLVGRLEKFDGNGTPLYKQVDSGTRLVIDPDYYSQKIADSPSYWKKNGSNSLVVVRGMMHELGLHSYKRLIDNIKASRKAEPGAAFLFIDRWPAPSESMDPVSNTKARRLMNGYDDHAFAASIRSGNSYGYLYFIRHVERLDREAEEAPQSDNRRMDPVEDR